MWAIWPYEKVEFRAGKQGVEGGGGTLDVRWFSSLEGGFMYEPQLMIMWFINGRPRK